MEFASLATALDAHVDKSKKIPKIICACPVGCGGTLTAKDFGDPDPVLICSAACSKDSIRSAIKRLEARSDPAEQSRERDAGEETPHSPASSNGKSKHSPPSKVAYALAYARRGIKVFPLHEIESDRECSCGKLGCDSAGKHPRMSGWQGTATCDEDQIKDWWREWPNANVGVKCGAESNLTVLDVDGDEGRESLRELELEHGELPETPIAITGRGGAHYLFAFEPGLQNAVKFTKGLDVRTEGGLIVGVGSKTKGPYMWEAAFTIGDVQLAQMPQWLGDQIRAAGPGAHKNGSLIVPEKIPSGERNNWLYKTARSLKAKGLSAQAIESAVLSENAVKCVPPMPTDEVRAIVAHATSQPDQKNFQVPAQTNGHAVVAPLVIEWETYSAAVAANEEYLKREPVVDKLLYRRAASMIVGGKHHGKSTLTRWLAMCVLRGWQFLGRDVRQGPVFYIASEDEEMAARSELMNLGWKEDTDALYFLPASRIGDDRTGFLDWVIDQCGLIRPGLVVIDMLFDFLNIKDEMSYAETRRAVGEIQRVATRGDTHVTGTHHSPKHSATDDAAVAALGSQGLAAKVSPIVLVRKFGPGVHSVSSTSVRDPRGEAILNSRLLRNTDGSMELGGAFKTFMLAEVYMPRVVELLEAEPGAEMTVGDVVEGLTIPYEVARACLSSMVKLGTVTRTGQGKKGKPYRYAIPMTEVSAANGRGDAKNTPRTPIDMVHRNSEESPPETGWQGYKD
jgi:hypothetical protein